MPILRSLSLCLSIPRMPMSQEYLLPTCNSVHATYSSVSERFPRTPPRFRCHWGSLTSYYNPACISSGNAVTCIRSARRFWNLSVGSAYRTDPIRVLDGGVRSRRKQPHEGEVETRIIPLWRIGQSLTRCVHRPTYCRLRPFSWRPRFHSADSDVVLFANVSVPTAGGGSPRTSTSARCSINSDDPRI